MRINEVRCDACGKKIEKPVFGLILMEKDADYASGNGWDNEPKLGELDFCNECKEKIVKAIREFASPDPVKEPAEERTAQKQQESEKDGGGPLKNFKPFVRDKEEQPEMTEEERKRYAKMKIRTLLEEGVSVDDIVKIKGCCKQSVYTVKYKMKKQGEKISDYRTTIEGKDGAAVEATNQAAVEETNSAAVKTHDCAEVMETCVYASRLGGTLFCDYFSKTGKLRKEKPSECTVYVPKK
jgi:hypothetical protein